MVRLGLIILLVASPSLSWAKPIGICTGGNRAERKVTCIHDGDTGWERGVKWRLIGVDTPELGNLASCEAEHETALVARDRLIELMRRGYTVQSSGRYDRSKRLLVSIRLSDGRDAGAALVREGLAQPWPNSGNPWCRR